MKCTSCVSSRTKSDDDEEDEAVEIASPTRTMDKIEEEYRVESPPTIPEQPTTSRGAPSVTIIEIPPDYRGESSRVYDIALDKQHSPSPSSSSHLLRPLDVITEETSDISDSENRPPQPLKPDLCFPRPKAHFKKGKSRNLLKSLLQPKQEQTTCVLVDAKIAESAPEEYRSVCTTEVVPEEILEVEVIDLGSNSSSLADLTEIDDLEENPPEEDPYPGDDHEPERDQDKINNNGTIDSVLRGDTNESRNTAPSVVPPPPPNRDDNDNEIDLESSATAELVAEREDEQLYSEEDNNHYDHDVESKTSEIFTQTHAATQNDGSDDDDGDDDDDDASEFHENDRTESDRDCEDDRAIASLSADVDRAGVVTQQYRNVIEVKECTEDELIDCDCVTHRNSSSSSSGEDRHPEEVIDDSGAVDPKTIKMTEESEQVPKPPPPIPLPPPPAALAASTRPTASVAPKRPPPPPPSPSADDVTNLGQDDISGGGSATVARENAQIHSGSDTGEADYAHADQNSAQDSVDAVVEETATDGESDTSVLLKFLQDSQPLAAEASVENRPTFSDEKPQQNLPEVKTKIERTVKNGQLNYEIVQDHRVLRKETVTTATAATHTSATGEVILRRHQGSRHQSESHPKEPSPEQKAALVHDLRNEISRIKDAELQEEFRKLELEAARFEQELDEISTIMPTSAMQPPHPENLTYYVSKQNDFAVERPPPPRSKPPAPVAVPTASKPNPSSSSSSVAKSSSNDQMYNEWQQKMEEREARRLHKTIQLSKTPNEPAPSQPIPLPVPPQTPPQDPPTEDEFLRKMKDRRRKFTFPATGGSDESDGAASAPSSTPATPVAGRKPVPKHIEAEFAQFAEIRKQQQLEQQVAPPVKTTENNAGESSAGDGTIDQRPPGLLVLASAIGIVVWSVCRVLFGRK